MSSVKSANHPTNWRAVGNPKKNDIIEGVIIGNKETKTMNTMNGRKDYTPETMSKKLTQIAKNSSNEHDQKRANLAITLLEPLKQTSTLDEAERRRIFEKLG